MESYSLSLNYDTFGFLIYRVSNSIHSILAITCFEEYGITVEELYCSQYVSYAIDGNTISFTDYGNILYIGN